MKNNIYPWQQTHWQQLVEQHQQQRLPHALLLQGPTGIGKTELAKQFAASLLCSASDEHDQACGQCQSCRWLSAGSHPDFIHLQPEAPENTTSQNPVLSIRIDRIRQLCNQLATTSQLGGYRIALIENAERMVVAAANSLLKTLEEPGNDTLIMLTSTRPYRLPVTIRSRCQLLRLPLPTEKQALHWLDEQNISDSTGVLRLAHGAPLLAVDYAETGSEQRQLLCSAMLAAANGNSALEYAQALSQLPRERSLGWLLDWVSDVAKCQSGSSPQRLVNADYAEPLNRLAKRTKSHQLFGYHELVCSYIRAEAISLNPLLLWENLLISWDKLYI